MDLTGAQNEDSETVEALRAELQLLKDKQYAEDERLRRLVHGTGKGRPKSAEFEFAARTILATGCSARAAQDNILIAAGLFWHRNSMWSLSLKYLQYFGSGHKERDWDMRLGCIQ